MNISSQGSFFKLEFLLILLPPWAIFISLG